MSCCSIVVICFGYLFVICVCTLRCFEAYFWYWFCFSSTTIKLHTYFNMVSCKPTYVHHVIYDYYYYCVLFSIFIYASSHELWHISYNEFSIWIIGPNLEKLFSYLLPGATASSRIAKNASSSILFHVSLVTFNYLFDYPFLNIMKLNHIMQRLTI